MKYLKKFILLILGGTFFFSPPQARAFSQSSISVSPAIIEEALAPEEKKTAAIWITNLTNSPLPIKTKCQSFIVEDRLLKKAGQTFNASSWLKATPESFILQPREQKKIILTIHPPKNAEPGGHYATLYFQSLVPSSFQQQKSTFLSPQIGILIFLTIKGKIIRQAHLSSLQTKAFSSWGPVNFSFSFQNQGNIHLLPQGKIIIQNFWGKEVAQVPITPQIILPKTEKKIKVQWSKRFLLGRFKAQAFVTYSSAHIKMATPPIIFWVIPWFPIPFLTTIITLCILVRKRLTAAIKILMGRGG